MSFCWRSPIQYPRGRHTKQQWIVASNTHVVWQEYLLINHVGGVAAGLNGSAWLLLPVALAASQSAALCIAQLGRDCPAGFVVVIA